MRARVITVEGAGRPSPRPSPGVPGEGGRPGAGGRWWAWQARYAPYLFVAPFVVLFCVFLVYPLAKSVVMSLHTYAGAEGRRYVGLGHYRFFVTDLLLWIAVANTVVFTVVFVCLQIPMSLGLAMLLNGARVRFRNLFRFAFFSPFLVGHVFVSVIFMLMLSRRQGLVPRVLGAVYGPWAEVTWLGDPVNARVAVVVAGLWLSVGWGMVFFLAALQAVDRELYEAAAVDGAGRWARFRHVTLPGIRPVLTFLTVTTTIGAFQLFELPYVLFLQQGSAAGPGWAGLTIVMYLYQQGFDVGDLGAACAVGWFLVTIILGVALVQIRVSRAGREEE